MRPFPGIDVDASTGVTDQFAARVFAAVEMPRTAASAANVVRGASGSCEIAFELLPPSDPALLSMLHMVSENPVDFRITDVVLAIIRTRAIAKILTQSTTVNACAHLMFTVIPVTVTPYIVAYATSAH